MRVISGKLKGRIIRGFDILGTRPTMDRVKESIFGTIQNYVNDAIVLDLFSGSGNLGFEALSNGAKLVYFNDLNKKCVKLIQENLNEFNMLDSGIITNLDYEKALIYYKKNNIKFDLVFLDPPYKEHIVNDIICYLCDNHLLNHNSLIICEVNKVDILLNDKIKVIKEKRYGDKEVIIYKFGN